MIWKMPKTPLKPGDQQISLDLDVYNMIDTNFQ